MSWDHGLLEDQRIAASHVGSHARLLAGPGTGKTLTLTRRIAYLIQERGVLPGEIAALTFTRVAASQLRESVKAHFAEPEKRPPPVRISTLHSFALRQLLKNADRITVLPKPLRIADDWDEKHIVQEDLKSLCQHKTVRETRKKLNLLSADWDNLEAQREDWEQRFPDPKFIGAWNEHRQVYGYALRAELVYQLKRALERESDFKLEDDFSHVLVDEYQDLNKCDQSILKVLAGKGAEVYVAGDDDQSIYGFRQANPNGIRVFTEEYPKARSLTLQFCKRCDKSILTLSEFVANLDTRRLPKSLMPVPEAAQGEVRLLRFPNQYNEARCVARLCKLLINSRGYKAEEILILLRSDLRGRYSSVLADAFRKEDVPLALNITPETPLDTDLGREFISLLRLCQSKEDSLAWRALLQVRKNNIGSTTIAQIYELARERGSTFTQALRLIETNPSICNGYGPRVVGEVKNIENTVREVSGRLGAVNLEPDVNSKAVKLVEALAECSQLLIDDKDFRTTLDSYVAEIVTTSGATDLESLLSMLSIAREDAEQRVTQNEVNIMTMHKAKGLSADVVFVVAAEDELIPGRQKGVAADDERRLLYVSLTRARHALFVSYCSNRRDDQMYSGSNPGKTRRSLTTFLRNSPLQPLDGERYLATQN